MIYYASIQQITMKILLSILGVIIVIVLGFSYYLGAFKSVEIVEGEVEPMIIMYKPVVGEYSQSADVMDEMYYKLEEFGVSPTQGVGIYFDNPQMVETEKLRSVVGNIITEDMYATLRDSNADVLNEYEIAVLGNRDAYLAEFPFRNQFSVIVAIMKVYPEINELFVEEKFTAPIMEIYDMENRVIRYVVVKKYESYLGDILEKLPPLE